MTALSQSYYAIFPVSYVDSVQLTKDQKIRICEFLVENTKCFDSSHNWEHGRDVLQLATDIAAMERFPILKEDVFASAAVTHDVADHKYVNKGALTEDEVRIFHVNNVGEAAAERIMNIVRAVSWSSQHKARKIQQDVDHLPEPDMTYLKIIRDADRIQAIGLKHGIGRCMAFARAVNPNATEADITAIVLQHCHDKLLRLYNENYIVTKSARSIALPLHQEIIDWVALHTPLPEEDALNSN